MEHKNTNELGTKSIGKLLFIYSIPSILGMVIVSLNQIISSIYIGHGVGHIGLSAMAVTFPVINLLMAFCQLVALGCAALCSIELGRRNMQKASSMLGHSVIMEIAFGTVFGLIFWFFLDSVLTCFGASQETLPYARDFMLPLIVTSPIGFLMLGFNFMARATGYPKTAMVTSLLSSVGIIIFSPLFIFEWGWGMYGAAWAQVMGQVMSVLWLAFHFSRKSSVIHFTRNIWTICFDTVKRIVAVGMAPFLINFCACIVVVIINRILLEYGGDMAIGAYGIINRLLMLYAMSVVGLGQGMQPIVGFNFGAKKKTRVRMALKYGVITGTVITLTGMLLSMLIPEMLVRMFTKHEPLIELTVHSLRLCTAMFILVGPQIVIGTYFQSIGQSKIASIVSMLRQMIFLVPSLLILPRFFDLDGVWMSLPVADVFGGIVAAFFLYISIKAEDNPCRPDDLECTPPPEFFRPKQL